MIMNKKYPVILSAMLLPMSAMGQQAIDVHCHNVLPEFVEFLEEHGMEMSENYPLPMWDVGSHLSFMDAVGIACSVVSMPAPQPCWGGAEECSRMVRRYNEACARLKASYPGKFLFCASLPLPYVEAAIDEAIYALDSLGADAIKLATNSCGLYVGDEALDRLMSVLNERHAVVMLHPHKPVPVNNSIIATTPLAMYEYPAETTRAVVNMIMRNVPARYSAIKFIVPHSGSFLPLALPRIQFLHKTMVEKGVMGKIDWYSNLTNLYYDLAGGVTPELLQTLLLFTTPDHLLYGSDYPYQSAERLVESMKNLRMMLSKDKMLAMHVDEIFYGNASRLFAIESSKDIVGESPIDIDDMRQCVKQPMQADGIVRLSKIEVYPEYLETYMQFAIEVGEISLRTEPGVLTMYAVAEKENPCMITILETYASQEAYRLHIASSHFQKYKQGTLHMVRSLVLSDQDPLNPDSKISNFIQRGSSM